MENGSFDKCFSANPRYVIVSAIKKLRLRSRDQKMFLAQQTRVVVS